MRYRYKLLLSALGGFSFGAAVEAFILKRKHRKEQEEARDTLRKYYKDKVSAETEKATVEAYEALDKVKVELEQAKAAISSGGMEKKMEKEERTPGPEDVRIIAPDEFGVLPDYDRFYYTYCASDGVFYIDEGVDTPAEAQEIQDMFLGLHPEEHFGEYEEDAVYIRNDDLKTDIAVFLAEETSEDLDE